MKSLRSALLREDRVCPWWLAYTFDNPLRRFLHNPVVLLGPHVREGMTVADIGCGMGYFSIAMAKMVGEKGTVLAVDLQKKMLDRMRGRAEKAGLTSRIRSVRVTENDIGITEPVDFVLAFWMVHEVPEIPRFLSQVNSVLKESGKFLIAEPRMHVSNRKFRETLEQARAAGFKTSGVLKVRMSRAVILSK